MHDIRLKYRLQAFQGHGSGTLKLLNGEPPLIKFISNATLECILLAGASQTIPSPD